MSGIQPRPIWIRDLDHFTMQRQEHDDWGWAAVACSVNQYFKRRPSWPNQCQLVNAMRHRSDCCENGSSAGCNPHDHFTSFFYEALKLTDNFASVLPNPPSKDQVLHELGEKRPVCFDMGWDDGTVGGKFRRTFCIVGCDMLSNVLICKDPDPTFGLSSIPLEKVIQYKGTGDWFSTFFVK